MSKKLSVGKFSVNLHAEEILEKINASCVILARSVHAHSNVMFAMCAGPSLWTHALEAANFVAASCAVETGTRGAIVDIDFAGCAGVTFATMTREFVIKINASIRANRTARIAQALIDLGFALKPDEARATFTHEAFELVEASSSVLARFRGTIVHGVLAHLSGIARLARARITASLIQALAIVSTRFIRALVNVRFASCPRPSRITNTRMIK